MTAAILADEKKRGREKKIQEIWGSGAFDSSKEKSFRNIDAGFAIVRKRRKIIMHKLAFRIGQIGIGLVKHGIGRAKRGKRLKAAGPAPREDVFRLSAHRAKTLTSKKNFAVHAAARRNPGQSYANQFTAIAPAGESGCPTYIGHKSPDTKFLARYSRHHQEKT